MYFDPVRHIAYRDIPFGSREFSPLKGLNLQVLSRCWRFDSIHEYYSYRIVVHCLPNELQLLRQVNFLVAPKSDLGTAVTYRADLVIAPKSVDEKTIRLQTMQLAPVPFQFLVIEPKGILTDSSRLKHLMLCATNRISVEQILFVASNHESLKLPDLVKTTLFHLPSVLREKITSLFGC